MTGTFLTMHTQVRSPKTFTEHGGNPIRWASAGPRSISVMGKCSLTPHYIHGLCKGIEVSQRLRRWCRNLILGFNLDPMSSYWLQMLFTQSAGQWLCTVTFPSDSFWCPFLGRKEVPALVCICQILRSQPFLKVPWTITASPDFADTHIDGAPYY